MPVITNQFALEENVAQRIVTAYHMSQEVHVHNHEHGTAKELYIGGNSSVSASNGHHVVAESDIVFSLAVGEELWGVTPNGAGCAVTVMQVQRSN